MLIICEVPHRLPPSVWHATDEADYTNRVAASAVKSGEAVHDYATATEYLERGLRALFIFRDEGDLADRIHTVPSAFAQSTLTEYL